MIFACLGKQQKYVLLGCCLTVRLACFIILWFVVIPWWIVLNMILHLLIVLARTPPPLPPPVSLMFSWLTQTSKQAWWNTYQAYHWITRRYTSVRTWLFSHFLFLCLSLSCSFSLSLSFSFSLLSLSLSLLSLSLSLLSLSLSLSLFSLTLSHTLPLCLFPNTPSAYTHAWPHPRRCDNPHLESSLMRCLLRSLGIFSHALSLLS